MSTDTDTDTNLKNIAVIGMAQVELEAIEERHWDISGDLRVDVRIGNTSTSLTLAELRDLERRARDIHTRILLDQAWAKLGYRVIPKSGVQCEVCNQSPCICY